MREGKVFTAVCPSVHGGCPFPMMDQDKQEGGPHSFQAEGSDEKDSRSRLWSFLCVAILMGGCLGEGNSFSLFVSSHPRGYLSWWGGYLPWLAGTYLGWEGTLTEGVPTLAWGVPILARGYLPWPGSTYLGQRVPTLDRGVPTLSRGGTYLDQGGYLPWLEGYPPWPGQHREYLLRGGRYASCVHAGGPSCCWFILIRCITVACFLCQ